MTDRSPIDGEIVLPIGTVTLLLADVEGSTRLWEAEPDTMTKAVASLDDVVAEAVGRHGGVRPVEQGEGDSFVVAFARASDALAAAIDLQHAKLAPIRLRIGIHTGEAQLRDEGNYIGPAVNRAARVRDLGHGGQTLLSQATRDLVLDCLPDGASLLDLGVHRLRDLTRPEHVHQLCAPGLRVDLPPLRSLDSQPNNLPLQLTTFIGREQEMETLRNLSIANRLVTLTGSGGCGKTRLALQLGAELVGSFDAGVWWVDLAPLGDPALVPNVVGQAMGIREVPGEPFTATLGRLLVERQTLIILDNCEHLVDACASLCHALLQACPRLAVLATSREPLGVDGETTWRVPSLAVAPDAGDIKALADSESVQLFTDRAARARPTFEVTHLNAHAVDQICRRLDGIPLAIELAAARVRVLSPEQIAAGLDDRFRLLAGGSRTAMPRQRTLEASVDWSFNLLTEEQRVLFRRLSVFAGSFGLDSAEAICGGADLEHYHVFDLLLQLVDRSLVQAEEDRPRYRLLETIRQYGRQKLVDAGEADAVRARHLAHYSDLVARARPLVEAGGTVEWLTRLDQELDNIRIALDWALAGGQAGDGLRLATVWPEHWAFRGHTEEGSSRIKVLTEAANPAPALMARSVVALQTIAAYLADIDAVLRDGEQGLDLARKVGDRQAEARALVYLGFAHGMREPTSASGTLNEALAVSQDAGDGWAERHATNWAGYFRMCVGDIATARSVLTENAAVTRACGDLIGLRTTLFFLGLCSWLEGRRGDAERELREALAVAGTAGDRLWVPFIKSFIGVVASMRGDDETAGLFVDQALREADDTGSDYSAAVAKFADAWRSCTNGDWEPARRAATDAASFLHISGPPSAASMSYALAASAALRCDDLKAASALVGQAIEDAADSSPPLGVALVVKAVLARSQGDLDEAESAARTALTGPPERISTSDALETLGGVLALQGDCVAAARLFGAGDALRVRMTVVRRRSDEEGYKADLAVVREALGGEAFSKVWAEGAAMSNEEAVAYATRGRGERKRPTTGWGSLTPAERDVSRLVGEGLANKEIAERLFISPRTVQAHLTHIYSKLSVSSRVQLANEAV